MKRKIQKLFSAIIAILVLYSLLPISELISNAATTSLTLRVTAGEGGNVSPTMHTINASQSDQSVSLSATANSGYQFAKWVDNTGGYIEFDNPSSPTSSAHTTTKFKQAVSNAGSGTAFSAYLILQTALLKGITAKFDRTITFPVKVDTSQQGRGTVQPTSCTFRISQDDQTFSITASPKSGYGFEKWMNGTGQWFEIVDSNSSSTQVRTSQTFKNQAERIETLQDRLANMSDDDVTTKAAIQALLNTEIAALQAAVQGGITANFYEIPVIPHNVTVQPAEGGTASADPNSNITSGTQVTLSATPNAGYQFERWNVLYGSNVVSGDLTANPKTFTMGEDSVVVSPVFKKIPPPTYSVTASVEGNGGTAEAKPSSGITQGSTVVLIAKPNAGYKFSHWEITPGGVVLDDSTSSVTTFEMGTQNISAKAIFEASTAPQDQNYNVVTSVNGDGAAMADPTSCKSGTTVFITAQANTGNQFKRWNVKSGEITLDNETNAATSFTMPASNVEIEAVFEEAVIQNYNVTTSVEGDGTASATPVSGPQGTTVYLTATPNAGSKFKEWQVSPGSDVTIANTHSNKTSFEIGEGDVEVKAVFEKITIAGISLNSDNAKKTYAVGDELDLTGVTLTVINTDGSSQKIPVTEDMVSGFDSSKEGKQTLTVTYNGYPVGTYEVEVKGEGEEDPTNKGSNPSNYPSNGNGTGGATNGTTSNNTSSGSSTIPDTGDHRNFALWIVLMVASTMGLIFSSSWWERRLLANKK